MNVATYLDRTLSWWRILSWANCNFTPPLERTHTIIENKNKIGDNPIFIAVETFRVLHKHTPLLKKVGEYMSFPMAGYGVYEVLRMPP